MARHRRIRTFYYISPQVWASRAGRVRKLARLVDHMMVIFPFEAEIYQNAGVSCSFVGHPLLDMVPEPAPRGTAVGPKAPVRVGLLPGSRPSEIQRHLPILLAAFEQIRRRFPGAQARLFAAANLPDSLFQPALQKCDGVGFVRETRYEERSTLDLALTCSGTATLENALLGIPMVVMYRMFPPTYWIAKAVVRVPYIALANILLGKPLVPELIQSQATPERVAEEALAILEDPDRYVAVRSQLLSLRDRLGKPGAAQRAAQAILERLA